MRRVSKAIVTGGAGFIGSHIVEELIKKRIETIVIDNLSTGSMQNLSLIDSKNLLRVYTRDVMDIGSLLHNEKNVDIIFHEAAIASVPRSVSEPLAVHDVNVNATLEVLNFCLRNRVRRIVFASSAAVYGRVETPPATEENLCKPSSPYGASKLAVEDYLGAYHQTYGLETVALRYFNVYGPRQRFSDYAGVITIFINQLLKGRQPVIFGDGTQSRDFVHVSDVVQANILSMESPDAVGEIFNVASGNSTTILELFQLLREATGAESIQPVLAAPRQGDVKLGTGSIAKIKSVLRYRPTISLRDGLSQLVEHAKREAGELAVDT